jgi:fatty acid-binding protein DegV
MVRGGRVSPLKGLLANLLNLNPIVSMDADGNSMVFGKTFSQKANMKKVMAHINRTCRDRLSGTISLCMPTTGRRPIGMRDK